MPEVDVRVSAYCNVGDAVVAFELEDGGSARRVLRGGVFRGELPARALRFRLVDEEPPSGEAPLAASGETPEEDPDGEIVEAEELFEHEHEIPADGRVRLQLGWGAHCHHDDERAPAVQPEGKRFGSFEHMQCAKTVGLAADGSVLTVGTDAAWFDETTPLPVGAGANAKALPFGQVIALAGDFYAHLDAASARSFADAWPPLRGVAGWLAGDYRAATLALDDPDSVRELRDLLIRKKDAQGALGEFSTLLFDGVVKGRFPYRRYLALASQNYCHFGHHPWDGTLDDARNEALNLWHRYRDRALTEARDAAKASNPRGAFERALVTFAFGCHFLTDLFASGHLRVPRRELGERFGLLVGSSWRSFQMHKEDNDRGLLCARRMDVLRPPPAGVPRTVWRAYGDGSLFQGRAEQHLGLVRESVRLAVEALFRAHLDAPAPDVTADDLLPVPLAPGVEPVAGRDRDPEGKDLPVGNANGWPLYLVTAGGLVARRVGDPLDDRYEELEESKRTFRAGRVS